MTDLKEEFDMYESALRLPWADVRLAHVLCASLSVSRRVAESVDQ